MNNLDNSQLVDLINKIIGDPADSIPEDLTDELIDYLSTSTLICPVDDDGDVTGLKLGPHHFLPACCDLKDFNRIFKDLNPKTLEFKELSNYLNYNVDGVIVNPGSFGFVVNYSICQMVFERINDNNKAPVTSGYDVKVRLNDFRPLTWRDLIIPENITFMELDDILKTLWGFNGDHLSCFLIRKDNQIIIDKDLSHETMMGCDYDASTTLIDEIFDKYNKITYWYDFGDDWQFDIEIKGKIDYDKKYTTIKRFKGKYDPIEDCKGVYGLSEIIYLSENPQEIDSSPFGDYVDYLEEFDMEYTQRLLKHKSYVKSMWRHYYERL